MMSLPSGTVVINCKSFFIFPTYFEPYFISEPTMRYVLYEGAKYSLSKWKYNFQSAQHKCQNDSDGGHLASVHSVQENAFINRLVKHRASE